MPRLPRLLRVRRTLFVAAALLLVTAAVAPAALAAPADQTLPTIPLSPGFAALVDAAPETVGDPVGPEMPGDLPDSTILPTTTGLLYWAPGLAPTWTDGAHRVALADDTLVQWDGESLTPPPPPPPAPALAPALPGGTATNSAVERRLDCIARFESHNDPRATNPRSGAAGMYQFMPGTWASTPQGRAGLSPYDPVAARDAARWLATQPGKGFGHWDVVLAGLC